ncbi:MAG: tripartite tricarboxylate transporter substrate-binding protein, partial [Proteobacteria bacterium]|nr:tripartite tricarboxylate transporter substrate-binding protein [Pseudomonadota bacterium]
MVKVRRFAVLLAVALGALCSGVALGQGAFPDRPLRLVVPFPPGGSTDIVARVVAGKMAEGIGKAVIVDNKPGAAGNVATAEVAKGAADGYTMLFHIATTAV